MHKPNQSETTDSIKKVKSIFEYEDVELKHKDERKISLQVEPFSPYFRLGTWWQLIWRW